MTAPGDERGSVGRPKGASARGGLSQKGRLWSVVRAAASVLVLVALVRGVERERLGTVLGNVSWTWLGAAMAGRAVALAMHGARLWLALPAPRPPLMGAVAASVAGSALNLVLPARGGDAAAAALLVRRFAIPGGVAAAALVTTGMVEAIVFALFCLASLVLDPVGGAAGAAAGAAGPAPIFAAIAVAALGAGFAVGPVARFVAGRLSTRASGPLAFIASTCGRLSETFARPREVAANAALAALQVAVMVGGFAFAFPAVGLPVESPVTTAAAVLALSSVASIVLPPSLGAGPAAAAAAVLPICGVDRTGALAYAAAWWVVVHVPIVALGLPGLWWATSDRRTSESSTASADPPRLLGAALIAVLGLGLADPAHAGEPGTGELGTDELGPDAQRIEVRIDASVIGVRSRIDLSAELEGAGWVRRGRFAPIFQGSDPRLDGIRECVLDGPPSAHGTLTLWAHDEKRTWPLWRGLVRFPDDRYVRLGFDVVPWGDSFQARRSAWVPYDPESPVRSDAAALVVAFGWGTLVFLWVGFQVVRRVRAGQRDVPS